MSKVLTLKVSEEEHESRVDKWLGRRFPTLSHGLVQKLLRTGQVRVNGARAKGGLRLEAGELISLHASEFHQNDQLWPGGRRCRIRVEM